VTAGSGERSFVSLILGGIWRQKFLILGCCVVAGAAALAVSLAQPKAYTATASLLFRNPGYSNELFGTSSSITSSASSEREATTNVSLLQLPEISDLTAEQLGSDLTGKEIEGKISVSAGNKSEVVSIQATAHEPKEAKELANAFAYTYVRFRRSGDRQQVANARERVDQRLDALSKGERNSPIGESLANQSSRLQTLQALQTGNAEVVQTASLPTSPSSPKPVRNTVAAVIIGLLVGIGIAVLLGRLDRRLRRVDEFEEAFDLPILTAIPDNKSVSSLADARSGPSSDGAVPVPEAQAFQMLRARLRYFNVDRDIKTVLVTSGAPGDGKSTVAWEMAAIAALSEVKVLLIEAEFYRPTVASRYRIRPTPGLSEFLTHQTPFDRVVQSVAVIGGWGSGKGSVDVITAGLTPPNPIELLESQQMKQLLESVRADYDFVVIDTPPVLQVADAIPLMPLIDGVIVVGCVGKTSRDEARKLQDELLRLKAPGLGVVANRVRRRTRDAYAYDYYTAERSDDSQKESASAAN
jgi:succinoglycan biosynthesis transport protein ExoP